MMFFRFLLIFLVVLVLYRTVRRLLLPGRGRGAVHGRDRDVINRGEMVRDPVCGTYVSREGSTSLTVDGREYFFCSPECRDEFRRDGARSGEPGERGR